MCYKHSSQWRGHCLARRPASEILIFKFKLVCFTQRKSLQLLETNKPSLGIACGRLDVCGNYCQNFSRVRNKYRHNLGFCSPLFWPDKACRPLTIDTGQVGLVGTSQQKVGREQWRFQGTYGVQSVLGFWCALTYLTSKTLLGVSLLAS